MTAGAGLTIDDDKGHGPAPLMNQCLNLLILGAGIYAVVGATDGNLIESLGIVLAFGVKVVFIFLERLHEVDVATIIIMFVMIAGSVMIVAGAAVAANRDLQNALSNLGSGLMGTGLGAIAERERQRKSKPKPRPKPPPKGKP
jgi:hypothetical protein